MCKRLKCPNFNECVSKKSYKCPDCVIACPEAS